jgi:hypothetical protein
VPAVTAAAGEVVAGGEVSAAGEAVAGGDVAAAGEVAAGGDVAAGVAKTEAAPPGGSVPG